MRSAREIAFRLRQELVNAWFLAVPPVLEPHVTESISGPLVGLPDLSLFVHDLTSLEPLAEEIVAHRFRLLGLPLTDLGPRIAWRKDFIHGKETGTEYFRQIPYLDFQRAGDHKIVWELNRHQHLVALAQAFLLTGRPEFLDEIPSQLESWLEANPFQRGINWCSALEVAFRALSWIWVLHLVGAHLDASFRKRWITSLYQHGLHIETNLSVYFSPNTHLLGEAVVLHGLGTLLPSLPRAHRWRELGSRLTLEQIQQQVRDDGSHFEQSSYYHLYAHDLFLFHSLIAQDAPVWYRERLGKMADFLGALVSDEGILPMLGDEDGGRVFHPYGDRRRFWNPQRVRESKVPPSRWFPNAGIAVLRSESLHVIVQTNPFGAGTAGHSHAGALSVVAFHKGAEALIDPGTCTYSDPVVRERFRATAAHNTIAIQGTEQASPQGPFRWAELPVVELLHHRLNADCEVIDAVCRYRGFTHRRRVILREPGILVVVDRVNGPPGEWTVEQRWLCGEAFRAEGFSSDPAAFVEPAERSLAYGSSIPAERRVARRSGALPAVLVAMFDFSGHATIQTVSCYGDSILIEHEGGAVHATENGPPEVF